MTGWSEALAPAVEPSLVSKNGENRARMSLKSKEVKTPEAVKDRLMRISA